jgi:hypothetical protein
MKRFKVWLALALVFIAGFAAGVVTTRAVAKRVVRAALAHPGLIRARIEHELDRKLRLDARQRGVVHQVLLHTHEQLTDLRVEIQPQLGAILGAARQNISAVLTPDQQKRFEKYLAEHPLPQSPGGQGQPGSQ